MQSKSAQDFIERAAEIDHIPVEYLWYGKGYDNYGRPNYVAALCLFPGIKALHPEYKLFVQETVNEMRIVYERSFQEVPSNFAMSGSALWFMDSDTN